jgi:hypothetical protein
MTAYEKTQSSVAAANAVFQEEMSPNGYTVCDPPVATLELKEGVTEVSMTVGQTIDLLDCVTTNYPNCVYCSSDDYSAFTPTEAHKITCNIAGHTSTIHIKIATPTSVLERTLQVNSNNNNSGEQQQGQAENDENQDDGDNDNDGDEEQGGGDAVSYSFNGKQTMCVFTIEDADGKYNVKHNGTVIFTGISQLTFKWTGNYQPADWGGNAGSININSPWSTVLQQPSNTAQGSYTVNLKSAFSDGEARTITFSNNNSGSSFYLEVIGQ